MKKEEKLYQQVVKYIIDYISDNNLKPGDLLPTEAELEENLKVSRTTVRSAILELQHKGYVVKQQGKGTFVADKTYEEQLPSLKSFTQDAKNRGHETHSNVLALDVILPNENIANKLQITQKDEVLKILRVRYLGDEPIQISNTHLPLKVIDVFNWDNVDFSTASLYEELQKAGIYPDSGEEKIGVDIANAVDASLLNVPKGFPIFLTNRIVLNEKGMIIEYSESRTRGDRHKATIKLKAHREE